MEEIKGGTEQSWDCGGTAGELDAERAKASFDVERMTNFIDGGLKETIQRRWITSSTHGTPSKQHLDGQDRASQVAANFKHFMDVHKEYLDRFYVPKGRDMLYMSMGQSMSGYPGFGLFLATIAGQSSAEQLSWWLPRVYSMGITGSYSQTELGTGSNVRALQTTAVFDKSTQEFVLDTPTLQSMKWWPSSLTSSTHTVVYAQLIIDGKEYGVHPFFVQVRDEELRPLPGVEVKDLGSKAGENAVDIGLLRLRGVRIPRRHLFEKRQHVEPDGTYVKHDLGGGDNEKGAYLTMMTARVTMVSGASVFLSKGATIAVRYNAVRRQGFKDGGKGQSFRSEQNKIIDYGMNQFVLLKNLALAFAIRFTSNWLSDRLGEISNMAGDGDDGEADKPDSSMRDLPEMHASSAGLKGYCCNASAVGLEELRKCCGGAGYLMASGIAPLVADYKWRATAEGDTNVMLLETAKFLMKACEDARAGAPLSGLAQCLAVLRDPAYRPAVDGKPPRARAAEDFLRIDYLLEWFRYRTVSQVQLTRAALDARMAAGASFQEAWAALTLRAVNTGQSHVLYFMLSKFAAVVEGCEDAACRAAQEKLCALFALADMIDGKQWAGLYDLEEAALIEEACAKVCSALRPDAVALVDAWDYSDESLDSTIGCKDGNIYERQYQAALSAAINKEDKPVFLRAAEQYLDKDFLALRNKPDPMCEPDDTSSYPPARQASKL